MTEPLVFVGTSDLSGKLRGKAFPLTALPGRLDRGMGWTPTNVMITCFDGIADGPFGSLGDLVLMPDPAAAMDLDLSGGIERVILSDIRELDGTTPWGLCGRSILKAAIIRLNGFSGLRAIATFEHEFQLLGGPPQPGQAFGLAGFSARRHLGERIMAALRSAGCDPDSFLREYGSDQYEVTIDPKDALRAADEAVLLREIVRLVARDEGETATFSPITDPTGVGNGVHVHVSLRDADGVPVTWDKDGPGELSPVAASFVAGILKYLPSMVALTAASNISYLRLTPQRWSAAYNNLGFRDREAALRICPVTGRTPDAIAQQYNFEYRAADATASPYITLAAILHAGCQGIEEGLTVAQPAGEDLSLLSSAELAARGVERLPETLDAALDRLESDRTVASFFPVQFLPVYLALKRAEIAALGTATIAERCARYLATY